MKLKAVRVGEKDSPFRFAAMVVDESIHDKRSGSAVAFVVYSSGGNIIYWFKEGYDPLKVMVAGETFMFETMATNRFKQYMVIPKDRPSI